MSFEAPREEALDAIGPTVPRFGRIVDRGLTMAMHPGTDARLFSPFLVGGTRGAARTIVTR